MLAKFFGWICAFLCHVDWFCEFADCTDGSGVSDGFGWQACTRRAAHFLLESLVCVCVCVMDKYFMKVLHVSL